MILDTIRGIKPELIKKWLNALIGGKLMLNKIDNYFRTTLARNRIIILVGNSVMLLAVTVFYGFHWRAFAQAPIGFLLPVIIFFAFATTVSVYCCILI